MISVSFCVCTCLLDNTGINAMKVLLPLLPTTGKKRLSAAELGIVVYCGNKSGKFSFPRMI